MQVRKDRIFNLYLNEVKGKYPGEYVKKAVEKVGYLPQYILRECPVLCSQDIFLSSRALMHIQEKRREILEGLILPNAYSLLCFPSGIYENDRSGKGKRADILLVKELGTRIFLIAALEFKDSGIYKGYHVVTIIHSSSRYLDRRKCLWKKRMLS